MFLLILFAFVAGIVTILSPCILPVLPILLSTAVGGGRKRPLGVVSGFVVSFTFFTLALATLVRACGLPPSTLRTIAIGVVGAFGLIMLLPQLSILWERVTSRFAFAGSNNATREGFGGGLIIGLSLGLLWAPCVGPIMASVITLAATGTITTSIVLLTLAYSLGTAVPMLLLLYGGGWVTRALPFLRARTALIQRVFGGLMVLLSLAMFFNVDRAFQSWVLTTFPSYGTGLTKLEENSTVKEQLRNLNKKTDSQPVLKQVQTQLNQLFDYGPAADFSGGTHWLNSQPLTLTGLKGKVVLVDFWTYSCINCIRTLPYVTSWYSKYKDAGLVVVGVHSPEFAFEKETKNVEMAIRDFKIDYPVVQDNDFAIWKAYNNQYWPAKYLIDSNGRIRYVHFGEGEYDKTETVIQQLLQEVGSLESLKPTTTLPEYQNEATSPETYMGYWRLERFASPEELRKDAIATYTLPKEMPLHNLAFSGDWSVAYQYASPVAGAKLVFLFEGKQVNLVMQPKGDVPARARVWLDGQIVKYPIAGTDVTDGTMSISEPRLYNLLQLSARERHTVVIEFLDGNAQVYAFTFG